MSLEAAVAWEVCASIHQTYAKGKDGLFTTRQADFIKHADDARMKATRMKAEWQGLTDIEIHDCFQNRGSDKLKTRKMIAAAIEAKLQEKNT
jgi:hypothetical protein